MIDLRYVKKLVELLDGSSVDSIEIASDKGMKIRISKTPQRGAVQVAAPVQLPPPAPVPTSAQHLTPADGAATVAAPAAAPPAPEPPRENLLEVKSPMVGTFYRAPEPGAQPYVSEGSRIEKGQILCIIEAMKIMNEIESEYSGVIRDVQASDAHPVEYGQVLFRIEPNG
ncbi:MAG TPA: acetyl-CoA carboxylase biotin carboxyl carrier protein [Gemmatimonadaceae bacterium]|nr:acetyl-CoA carboxylase biotin carboxyl carrier protein [Gemmatimonadaceae bacterium]